MKKIGHSGAMLADGIKFDHNNKLTLPTQSFVLHLLVTLNGEPGLLSSTHNLPKIRWPHMSQCLSGVGEKQADLHPK